MFWRRKPKGDKSRNRKPDKDHERPEPPRPSTRVSLDRAIRLMLPQCDEALRPVRFKTPDGLPGWILRMPQQTPVATPAFEGGLLFVGGGFGSHRFYACDALTGNLAWETMTPDDGPSAAVVERGHVAFNTESCTLVVCDAYTGRTLWKKWLGDPLMSQPTIHERRLYAVYPMGPRSPLSDPQAVSDWIDCALHGKSRGTLRSHRLLCMDLFTGQHLWDRKLSGDALTAPIVEGDELFITCLDGTTFCFDALDGHDIWTQHNGGTSAPLIVENEILTTEKQVDGERVWQRMVRRQRKTGELCDAQSDLDDQSSALIAELRHGSGLNPDVASRLDQVAHFSAELLNLSVFAAREHLGLSSVAGVWSYQGPRAACAHKHIFNVDGMQVFCLTNAGRETAWAVTLDAGDSADRADALLPPAMGRERLYLTSTAGRLLSVGRDTGEVTMLYDVGRAIPFQPCLANGRVYFGTSHGELVCIDTGDPAADGWYMWGGNARHNKVETDVPTDDHPAIPDRAPRIIHSGALAGWATTT